MKKVSLKKSVFMGMAVMTILTACQGNVEKVSSPVHIAATDEMNSESLVNAGEQLVGPYTFMLADHAFNMALEKDPTSQRALFYKALLKQMMAFKGVLTRIHPLAGW